MNPNDLDWILAEELTPGKWCDGSWIMKNPENSHEWAVIYPENWENQGNTGRYLWCLLAWGETRGTERSIDIAKIEAKKALIELIQNRESTELNEGRGHDGS